MLISIVIPTKNHLEDLLRPCLMSIREFSDINRIEVIVVANGCTDETVEYVKMLGEPFRVLEFKDPMGYPKATNAGIRMSNGDYVVLLNNDTIVQAPKDRWLNLMLAPFLKHKETGITGSTKNPNYDVMKDFLIFFCVMIKRELFSTVGLLDERFTPGAGEDMDYCIRANEHGYRCVQVPYEGVMKPDPVLKMYVGDFPMYHAAEKTVFGETAESRQRWEEVFKRNTELIKAKYSHLRMEQQMKYGGEFERGVVGRIDLPDWREMSRINWINSKNLEAIGPRILDLGCGSGFVCKFIQNATGVNYLGIDYNPEIIEFARKNYADIGNFDVNKVSVEFCQNMQANGTTVDTILIMELLEHLPDGLEVVQELKKSCKCLLVTTPYMEPPGFWGKHHKLHNLGPEHFPGFRIQYLHPNCNLADIPVEGDPQNLMLMEWRKDWE